MSATGRGKRGGGGADFFPTPPWCVHRLLDKVPLPPGRWLEPAVGSGDIVRAVDEHALCRGRVTWQTMDIRAEAGADICGDFIEAPPDAFGVVDAVLTNPPFNLALAFAQAALALASCVAFLQRINWLRGSPEHNAWMRANAPSVYVLPQRPSFDGYGTDATEYAWFVWGVGPVAHVGLLGDTPDDVRASHSIEVRRRNKAARGLFDEVA